MSNKPQRRYFKGQAPEWAQETTTNTSRLFSKLKYHPLTSPDEKPTIDNTFERTDRQDRKRKYTEPSLVKGEATEAPKRQVFEAEIVPPTSKPSKPADIEVIRHEEVDLSHRRRPARQVPVEEEDDMATDIMPARRPAPIIQPEESEEEESEEEESEEEELMGGPMFDLTFVPKTQRVALEKVDKEIQEEAERTAALEAKRSEAMKQQTRQFVQTEIVNELKKEQQGGEDDIEINAEIEEDFEKEYQLWRDRELARLRRGRQEMRRLKMERAEYERRQRLTDEELALEDQADPTKQKDRKKMKFMQSYYDAGAYYKEFLSEYEKTHDFSAATGDDRGVDMANLPKVLQVKNFGKMSRSKYTHLVDQDTSKLQDNLWGGDKLMTSELVESKRGGISAPATKKRKM